MTVEKDKRPVTGGPDPHTKTCDPGVPDGVFGFLHTQPRNVAVTEAHLSRHGSVLPAKNSNKRFGRLVDSCIGKMRVLQRGGRIVVAQQPADREDRLAMCESHGCIRMAKIMAADILDARLGTDFPPEPVESAFREVVFPVQ